ncbi:MAG: hypothetical protein LBS82_02605 [Spirochaetaceae bacterium]|jgi:hypothetical protein|nr:hypothetical protein [Spirochaetaceae bacterium]
MQETKFCQLLCPRARSIRPPAQTGAGGREPLRGIGRRRNDRIGVGVSMPHDGGFFCLLCMIAPCIEYSAFDFPHQAMLNAKARRSSAFVASETDPTPIETAPNAIKNAPNAIKNAPNAIKIAPILGKIAPIVGKIAPILIEFAPILIEFAPILIETAPILIETAPILIEFAPILIETAPILIETAPILIGTDPTSTEINVGTQGKSGEAPRPPHKARQTR